MRWLAASSQKCFAASLLVLVLLALSTVALYSYAFRSSTIQDLLFKSSPDSGMEGKQAGDRRELADGICFRWCPPGTFMMGSPASETGRGLGWDEDQVEVTITQGFWLGETEVSEGQWRKLMDISTWSGQISEGWEEFPIRGISQEDAVLYCEKLTSEERTAGRLPTGWKYALPTETQWEYACRAGSKTRFSFGDSEAELGDYAWFDENTYYKEERYAHRVGQKKPNSWGLRDMHGNVWEWCSDWYDPEPPGGRDPSPQAHESRVLRGGSWIESADQCWSAYRGGASSNLQSDRGGFRVAAVRE